MCEQPGVIWIFSSVSASEAFNQLSYITLAAGWASISQNMAFCLLVAAFLWLLCRTQTWISKMVLGLGSELMPPELEHFRYCLNPWAPVPTVPVWLGWKPRCPVISWSSQYCHQDKVNFYYSCFIYPLEYKFPENRNYVFSGSQCGSYKQMMLKY